MTSTSPSPCSAAPAPASTRSSGSVRRSQGILHPGDVDRARAAGIDGAWISNHGGRQLDAAAVAPLDMLPEVKLTAGGMAVMLDGGLRRGTDVLKVLAAGTDFTFIGRPFLFAAAAAGPGGVARALFLLAEEIDHDLALMGARAIGAIAADCIRLVWAAAARPA